MFKKLFFILVFILCVLYILFWWASGGVQKAGTFEGEIIDFGKTAGLEELEIYELNVLTWNISFAYGLGSDSEKYEPKSTEEMDEQLKKIGGVMRESNADVVFLQEIDFNSSRSQNIDQLEQLSKATGLRYGAYANSWEARYVPFPYWPISKHFGHVESGGAVLSRYPIKTNTVELYPKPDNNAWWYNAFYPFRYNQQVIIDLGYKELIAINAHLEAYDTKNRVKQATLLARTAQKYDKPQNLVLLAGDMNTLPTVATKRYEFPDNPDDDYRNDDTMSILNAIESLTEVIGEKAYSEYEEEVFTFPSDEPNRRLDYIFVSDSATVKSARVLKAGELSDHLPVYAKLAINLNN